MKFKSKNNMNKQSYSKQLSMTRISEDLTVDQNSSPKANISLKKCGSKEKMKQMMTIYNSKVLS